MHKSVVFAQNRYGLLAGVDVLAIMLYVSDTPQWGGAEKMMKSSEILRRAAHVAMVENDSGMKCIKLVISPMRSNERARWYFAHYIVHPSIMGGPFTMRERSLALLFCACLAEDKGD